MNFLRNSPSQIGRWIGLVASLVLGGKMILDGQVEMGSGIITAALSSSGVLDKQPAK